MDLLWANGYVCEHDKHAQDAEEQQPKKSRLRNLAKCSGLNSHAILIKTTSIFRYHKTAKWLVTLSAPRSIQWCKCWIPYFLVVGDAHFHIGERCGHFPFFSLVPHASSHVP